MTEPATAKRLRARLIARFPMLDKVGITHHWGGVLGVPRDVRPSVGLDRATGLAWAGGYVGSGVAAANAAGRTLADLVTETKSDLVELPWVDHVQRQWEPEPLRWLGVHAVTSLVRVADRLDEPRRRCSRLDDGMRVRRNPGRVRGCGCGPDSQQRYARKASSAAWSSTRWQRLGDLAVAHREDDDGVDVERAAVGRRRCRVPSR